MGKSRRLKAERRREQGTGEFNQAQPTTGTPSNTPTAPTTSTPLNSNATNGSFSTRNPAAPTPPQRAAGGPKTRPLPAVDRVTRAALITAVVAWVAGHVVPNGELAAVLGAVWGVAGIALGWRSPAGGLLLGLALAPFISGPLFQPVAEFLRAAPIWGSLARLLTDRLIAGQFAPGRFAPGVGLTLAATAAMFLFPITRITAQANGHGSSSTVLVEMLVIIGGASIFFASWIVATHLTRADVQRVIRSLPIPFAAAVGTALAAWLSIPIISNFAFDGITFGRLSGLGFPTPTAMGLAIATPLIVGTLWSRSRPAAIALAAAALLTMGLTESRGPILALIVAGAVVVVLRSSVLRSIKKIWLVAGAAGGFGALAIVIASRYGQQISEGRLPGFEGDSDRVTSWLASLQIALQSPLVGGGWTSVRFWNEGELGDKNVNFAHNLVLQGLADGGLPLGGAMLAVVLTALVGIWKFRKRLSPAWIAAAVALLVCGIWDMPHLRTFGAAFGGLALGLVSRKDGDEGSEEA